MLRGRNGGLIRAPIITENDGFFIRRWYAIPEYSGGVFAAIAAGGGDDFSAFSIHGNPDPNFVFATKDKGLQLILLQHRNLFGINRLLKTLWLVLSMKAIVLTKRILPEERAKI